MCLMWLRFARWADRVLCEAACRAGRILAFDCCAGTVSVAVMSGVGKSGSGLPDSGLPDSGLLAMNRSEASRGHAEVLLPMIAGCLDRAGLGWGDLGCMAATVGPGSFTGIRSCVAAAKGLALASGLRVMPVTVHEAIAAGRGWVWDQNGDAGQALRVMTRGGRGQVFVQDFDCDGVAVGSIHAVPADQPLPEPPFAVRVVSVGGARHDGGGDGSGDIGEAVLDARGVARAAALRMGRGDVPVCGFDLKPLYLRPPDARVSAGQSLLQRQT